MEILDRILDALGTRGLDQSELESLAGLSHGRLSKWLGGTGKVTAEQADRIARVLAVDLEWLITGEGDMTRVARVADMSEAERAVVGAFRASRLSVEEASRRLLEAAEARPGAVSRAVRVDPDGGADGPGRRKRKTGGG